MPSMLSGEFRECRSKSQEKLFYQLPHRLAFSLSQIAPASSFSAGHVFLGFTKCGQFILSYTHSCDTDDLTLQTIYRYRLHWWLFTPYLPLKKVAEVMLFGDQIFQDTLYENVYITVCQWPQDLTKILVYGYSLEGSDPRTGPQTRKVYITVTAVPSLDNCSACYQVATSYEEDDVAERWNSCVRFSCLKHGITVHTSFEMVPPFPGFMPTIQMKMKGHVVLNAGNFIHVLSVHLENIDRSKKETVSNYDISSQTKDVLLINSEESEDDDNENGKTLLEQEEYVGDNKQAVISLNDKIDTSEEGHCNSLKISLRDQHDLNDKDREWEILIRSVPNCKSSENLANKKPIIGYQSKCTTQDCNIKNIDSDCSSNSGDISKNILVNYNNISYRSSLLNVGDDTYATDSDDSINYKISEEDSVKRNSHKQLEENISKSDMCSYDSNAKEFSCFIEKRCSEPSSDISSKRAEKEYEFIDEITEARHEKLSVFRRRRLAEKKYEFSDENSENIPQNYRSFRSQSRRIILSPSRSPRWRTFSVPFSELSVDLGEPSGLFRSVYEKLLSPSSSTDVLKPINQNISSPVLSPRDEKWREDFDKYEKNELQQWSSRESLYLYSPVSSYSQKVNENSSYVNSQIGSSTQGPQKLNCVVDIKRRYIEIEDELVSIITDIEDDDLSTATGYHNALSLEVHGSGYSQMHMISNAKAEKLMAPGVLVRQVSLDVEQFCHETAQRLCNESGKKYYFCNDYNVEIIDVCPNSGNVIALASVLVQAGNPKAKSGLSKSFRTPLVPPPPHTARRLYRANATFVFNVDTKTYYLLDKEPLVEEDPYSLDNDKEMNENSEKNEESWWDESRLIAKQLRSQWAIPVDYFSSVKVLTNESVFKGSSLAVIMERHHLVALVLGHDI